MVSFEGFVVERILSEDPWAKVTTVLGKFDACAHAHAGATAIVIVGRRHLTRNQVASILSVGTRIASTSFQNSIYSKLTATPLDVSLSEVDVTLICPATEDAVRKYASQPCYLVDETALEYQSVVVPYAIKHAARANKWVTNILDGTSEQESMIYSDPDPQHGFVILPDMKWDGRTLSSLYCLAVVRDESLRTVRDLRAHHARLCNQIAEEGRRAISRRFGIRTDCIRAYFHHQPSFYHLHVHMCALGHSPPGMSPERAISLDTVVQLLSGGSTHLSDATFRFAARVEDPLVAQLFAFRFFNRTTPTSDGHGGNILSSGDFVLRRTDPHGRHPTVQSLVDAARASKLKCISVCERDSIAASFAAVSLCREQTTGMVAVPSVEITCSIDLSVCLPCAGLAAGTCLSAGLLVYFPPTLSPAAFEDAPFDCIRRILSHNSREHAAQLCRIVAETRESGLPIPPVVEEMLLMSGGGVGVAGDGVGAGVPMDCSIVWTGAHLQSVFQREQIQATTPGCAYRCGFVSILDALDALSSVSVCCLARPTELLEAFDIALSKSSCSTLTPTENASSALSSVGTAFGELVSALSHRGLKGIEGGSGHAWSRDSHSVVLADCTTLLPLCVGGSGDRLDGLSGHVGSAPGYIPWNDDDVARFVGAVGCTTHMTGLA